VRTFSDGTDTTGTIIDKTPETAQTVAHLLVALPFVKHGFFHAEPPMITAEKGKNLHQESICGNSHDFLVRNYFVNM
jgi:hypothetical protein